jgi:hypothetical protein
MRIITGAPAFFESRAGALAAKAATAVFADQHDFGGVHVQPAGERIDRPRDALRGAVQIEGPVLPVGHRAARFHRLVTGGLHDECFIDDDRGILEAGVEVTVRPLIRHRAHRQRAIGRVSEVALGPFQGLDFRPVLLRRLSGGRRRGRWRRHPDVAIDARVGAGRTQALDRIDDERQRLEIELDALDRFRRGALVDGRQRKDRLALVERLVGQRAFCAFQIGKVVRGQDRLDARHRQCGAGVDVPDPGVWHRAQQQLREQHAVRAVVLGVLGSPGDLRHQIWRRVVPTDQRLV